MFGKHIFRSIKARPYQPLMIVLIIAISVAVVITTVTLPIGIYRDSIAVYGVDEWTEDLAVTLKATADVRLIFENEIAEAVGDRGSTIGEFALSGTYTDDEGDIDTLSISAIDLLRADGFYELRYVSYGKFTNINLKKSAILSERYANARGLGVGDSFTFNVLGREFTYTVQAIAMNTGIFHERDCLVDISGVRQILAERSSLIASLSTDFTPYTRVNIKLHDKSEVESVRTHLESMEAFKDMKISQRANAGDGDFMPIVRTVTVVMPGVMLVMVAVMLTVSSLELLQKKRRSDAALFRIVGADQGHLNMLSYLENLIYALLGGVVGCLIAWPLILWMNDVYDFEYTDIRYGVAEAAFGMLFAIAFTVLCTSIHIYRQKRESLASELTAGNYDSKKILTLKKFMLIIPVVIFGVLMCILPTKVCYIPAIGALVSLLVFVYSISTHVISWVSALLCRFLGKCRRGPGDLILAARSCENSYPLKHAGRLMTVLISLFASVSVVLSMVGNQLDYYTSFANFERIAVSADEQTLDMIAELPGVTATTEARIDRNVMLGGEHKVTGLAFRGSVDLCFNDYIFPKQMPSGAEIALSIGVARVIGAEVGDEIDCVVEDVPCVLTVSEIIPISADFVFYDADHVGAELNMLCILTDGSRVADESLLSLLDERGVGYISSTEFFADTHRVLYPHTVLFTAMSYTMMFLTVLGIANIIAEQRMARDAEFEVLKQNGKTKGGIIALEVKEILLLLIYALIMSVVVASLLCIMVDRGASSFGMALLLK